MLKDIRAKIAAYNKEFGMDSNDSDIFQNYEILFEMKTPILLSYPFIHFDGLLAHLAAKKALGKLFYELPARNPINFVDELFIPIKKVFFKETYFFASSVSLFDDNDLLDSTIIYKRFEDKKLSYLENNKKEIQIDSGLFKSYAMKMPINYSRKIFFYCKGIMDQINNLLADLCFLGKKTSYGYGEIKSYTIKTSSTKYWIKDNCLIKSLPVEYFLDKNILLENVTVANMAYKPPYWDKGNVTKCVIPGSKFEEKNYVS